MDSCSQYVPQQKRFRSREEMTSPVKFLCVRDLSYACTTDRIVFAFVLSAEKSNHITISRRRRAREPLDGSRVSLLFRHTIEQRANAHPRRASVLWSIESINVPSLARSRGRAFSRAEPTDSLTDSTVCSVPHGGASVIHSENLHPHHHRRNCRELSHGSNIPITTGTKENRDGTDKKEEIVEAETPLLNTCLL